jgi:tetratricopeptide (TPR) repeat protein
MTVGLPGTGIGGMFYLLSTLAMSLRELYRLARGRRRRAPGLWRVVAVQTAIAGGIVAGIWLTGWLVGVGLSAAKPIVTTAGAAVGTGGAWPLGQGLRMVVFALTIGTLVVVLAGVELLRLWVHRGAGDREVAIRAARRAPEVPAAAVRRVAATGGERRRDRLLVIGLAAVTAAYPPAAVAQAASPVAGRLARADSTFAAGNPGAAAREYAAVLAADPENSRATYRLAQLNRRDPATELRLFRRYVALEPSDPWGYMAVGDALARSGRHDTALGWYDAALALAPAERDAVVGRARVLVRARRTGAAIAAYERWLAAHPTDAEARRELTAARAAAAPVVTSLVSGSRDSDGNTTFRLGAAVDLAAYGPTRLGVVASRERVGGAFTTTGLEQLGLRTAWQPSAAVKVDATAGATRLDAPAGEARATLIPTGQLRARWRPPAAGPAVDFRARRAVLAASPLLVANRVVRTELGTTVEVPLVRSLRLRGIGRVGRITGLGDAAAANQQTTLGGVVALAAAPAVELSGQFREIAYSHSSTAYFAPRLAQVVEAGTYLEFETSRSVVFAFDVGAGVQRVGAHGGAHVGPWRRALRLYSLIVVPLAPGGRGGRDLRLELEGEDSLIASDAPTTGHWRYVSAALSLRWGLR